MANGGSLRSWWQPGAEFAGHIVMASLVLVLIGAAAVGISHFAHWLETQGVHWLVVLVFQGLEFLVYLVDALTYAIYVIVSAYQFITEIGKTK